VLALLHEGGRIRSRMVRANHLVKKLNFVVDVVSQWIENGGLGKLDADLGGEKLYWEGQMVKDQGRKIDRVTVGRCGGDMSTVSTSGSSRTTSARSTS
jgi:hypothetical protein